MLAYKIQFAWKGSGFPSYPAPPGIYINKFSPSKPFLRICLCYFLGQISAHLRAALHSTPGLIDPGAILWLPACVLSFPAEHAALGIRDLGILLPRVTTTFGELGARLKQNIYGRTHPSV